MNSILHTLFLDNPYIPEQVYDFCKTLPEYRETEQEYYAAEQALSKQLGHDTFNRFDEVQSRYIAQLAHAYYLFGLRLRQEVLSALEI